MASFVVDGTATSTFSLDSFETGVVTQSGAIIATSAPAVTMQGAANLVVLGSIAGGVGAGIVSVTGGTFATISTGEGSFIGNTDNTAILAEVSGNMLFDNAGTVRGEVSAFQLAASDDEASARVTNHGSLTGLVADGVNCSLGTGTLTLINTGEITGVIGLNLLSGALVLRNSGIISTFSTTAIQSSDLADRIDNTGTIFGDVLLGGGDDIFESTEGRIYGAVLGGDDNDDIRTDAGRTTLSGGFGDDILDGGRKADSLSGGFGVDTASYSGSSRGVTVDLQTGIGRGGDAEGDTLDTMENVIGSENADALFGDGSSNLLQGGLGDDRLVGRGGADTLFGESGADAMNGGDGLDTADYSTSSDAVVVNLETKSASGGDAKGDVLSSIENLTGSIFNDRLTGDKASNVLSGGEGNDILSGDRGDDTLSGLDGGDIFVFARKFGQDTVLDFDLALDQLDFRSFNFANVGKAIDLAEVSGADLVFSFGGGNTFTLANQAGINLDDLSDRILI